MSEILSKIEERLGFCDKDLLIEVMAEIVMLNKIANQRGKLLNDMYNHDDVILPSELVMRMSDAATGLDAIKLRRD